MTSSRLKPLLLMGAGVVVFCVIVLPYFVMTMTALKPDDEVYRLPPSVVPSDWSWGNFVQVWSEAPLATWLGNSLVVTVTATAITLLIATPAAYHLARREFRFKRLIMIVLLLGQMITPTLVIIGLYREFLALGLVNTLTALIIVNVAFHVSFVVWIMTSYFRSIPAEVAEAAHLDGCSDIGALWRVILPMAAPGVVTAAVFTFVSVWNEYIVALLLIKDRDLLPVAVGITSFQGQYTVQWQFLFAAALIAVLPIIVMFSTIEGRLVGGLTAGATK